MIFDKISYTSYLIYYLTISFFIACKAEGNHWTNSLPYYYFAYNSFGRTEPQG